MTTEKLICQETDRDGNIIDIWYCSKIAQSKASVAAQKAYQEIIDKKFATTENLSTILNNVDRIEVIYAATHSGKVITGHAFECKVQSQEAIMTLFFVAEEYRHTRTARLGRGLTYDHLFQNLIPRGITKIVGWINANNTDALAIATKEGWVQKEIRVVKQINA